MESRTSCQGASKPEIFTLAPRGTTHGSILAGLLCMKQSDSLDSERLHALRRAPMMAATKKRRMIITETVMMMILTSRFSICDQEVAHVLDGLLQKCTKRVAAKSTEVPCNQSSGMDQAPGSRIEDFLHLPMTRPAAKPMTITVCTSCFSTCHCIHGDLRVNWHHLLGSNQPLGLIAAGKSAPSPGGAC